MTPMIHTCRWCKDKGCLACDALRDARHKQEQSIQEGQRFLLRERAADRLPPEYADLLNHPAHLYLLGEAIAEGRRQAQAMGEHPVGNKEATVAERFGMIEIQREGG